MTIPASDQPDPAGPMSRAETQLWVLGAHLGPFALGPIAPLIVMLVVDNRSPFAHRQAVEALNFQLSFLIYFVVGLVLMLLLIGFLMLIAVGLLWVVLMVVAAVRSGGGQDYHYPLTIRFVS